MGAARLDLNMGPVTDMSEAGFGKKSEEEAAGETLELAKPTDTAAQEQSTQPAAEAKPAEPAGAAAEEPADTGVVEAEVRMSDGGIYVGTIELGESESVTDIVNSPVPFFRLVEKSGKVRLIGKSQVMQIIPFEAGTAAGRSGGSLM